MYEVSKTYRFDAAHMLPEHDGKCRNLHGHTYAMTVRMRSERLRAEGPKRGMVIDYADMNDAVAELLARFDHKMLNNELHDSVLPTAENLAWYCAMQIRGWLKARANGIDLVSVTISETPDTSATYFVVV